MDVLESDLRDVGNFILDSSSAGILGTNLLGGIEDQYDYYSIRKSKFAQKHKIILAHSYDTSAKILSFGFKYVYGKEPR